MAIASKFPVTEVIQGALKCDEELLWSKFLESLKIASKYSVPIMFHKKSNLE